MEDLVNVRKHVERAVTHIARECGTVDEAVWKQMLIASAEHFGLHFLGTNYTD